MMFKAPVLALHPLTIAPLALRNRAIKPATDEAMAKKGLVSKGPGRFHARMTVDSQAMPTVADCPARRGGCRLVGDAMLDSVPVADFRALTGGTRRGRQIGGGAEAGPGSRHHQCRSADGPRQVGGGVRHRGVSTMCLSAGTQYILTGAQYAAFNQIRAGA